MAQGRRLKHLPDSPFEPGERVRFQFEGRPIEGFDNEPIAVALLAAGVKVFGRSIKYHRPRGPVCLRGHCAGCLMRVDGTPNVRTCETLCRSGMIVERQTGWPSAGFDVLRAMDWFAGDRLDHHGMFTASSTVNRIATGLVRRFSGFGAPPTADPPDPVPLSRFRSDVVVVGGGASGLSAALAMAQSGHRVVLFEGTGHRGGRLLDGSCCLPDASGSLVNGRDVFRGWKTEWEQTEGSEIHINTPVLSIYAGEGFEVLASNPKKTFLVEADRLIVCTGANEQTPLFANNDIPGIFGIRAMDRLFCGHGVVPGEPVAIIGDSDRTLRLAWLLAERDVSLAGVVTNRREGELVDRLKGKNVPLYFNRELIRARGSRWLDRVELAPRGNTDPDLVLDCQTCAVEAPPAPAYELAHHAGCRVTFRSDSGYLINADSDGRTSHSQVFAAGHCVGAGSTSISLAQGKRAGLACALSIREDPEVAKRLQLLEPIEGSHQTRPHG
jgi:sarcosine oxidase, subunit alpha